MNRMTNLERTSRKSSGVLISRGGDALHPEVPYCTCVTLSDSREKSRPIFGPFSSFFKRRAAECRGGRKELWIRNLRESDDREFGGHEHVAWLRIQAFREPVNLQDAT
jgi:hypothetical protein